MLTPLLEVPVSRIYLFLLLLFLPTIISAQNDTLPERNFEEYQDTFCDLIQVKATSVIRFDDGADVFLDFGYTGTLDTTNLALYKGSNLVTADQTYSAPLGDTMYISDLDLDEIYYLYAYNSCGEYVPITLINTSRQDDETIVVSLDLFDLISQVDSSNSLYDVFVNDTTVSNSEKLSFVQSYIYSDSVFSRSIQSPYPIIEGRTVPECDCELVKTSPHMQPGTRQPQYDIEVPDGITINHPYYGYIKSDNNEDEGYWKPNNPSKGEWLHNYYIKGPARHQDVYAWGKCQGSEKSTLTYGSDNAPVATARIGIKWLCLEQPYGNETERCGCSKNVDYQASYDTRLKTNAHIISPGWCGDRGVKSKSEDWAGVFVSDNEGRLDMLAADRATIESTEAVGFNEDWFLEAADLAATIISIAGGNGISVIDLAEDIVNLLTTPLYIVDGGNDINQITSLIDKNSTFNLEPNIPTYLTLFSAGVTEVYGYSAWDGEARIASDFSLAVNIPGGWTGINPSCCSDAVGAWASSSFPESPNGPDALLSYMGTFYDLTDVNFVETMYGINWTLKNCDQFKPDDTKEIDPDPSAKDIKLTNINPVSYHIYDIMGRLISDGKITSNSFTKRVDIVPPKQTGLYFITINFSDGSHRSKKVFINNPMTSHETISIYID